MTAIFISCEAEKMILIIPEAQFEILFHQQAIIDKWRNEGASSDDDAIGDNNDRNSGSAVGIGTLHILGFYHMVFSFCAYWGIPFLFLYFAGFLNRRANQTFISLCSKARKLHDLKLDSRY